ncbi:hypothetical protein [Streptomyces sp. NPDC003077]|uniref:hypothetical protein n=1 Tax=Streptomyces sp. NPDC003077 TaxID=3154443 RepID=UPI0033B98514
MPQRRAWGSAPCRGTVPRARVAALLTTLLGLSLVFLGVLPPVSYAQGTPTPTAITASPHPVAAENTGDTENSGDTGNIENTGNPWNPEDLHPETTQTRHSTSAPTPTPDKNLWSPTPGPDDARAVIRSSAPRLLRNAPPAAPPLSGIGAPPPHLVLPSPAAGAPLPPPPSGAARPQHTTCHTGRAPPTPPGI